MSSRVRSRLWITVAAPVAAALFGALEAAAQYPGLITNTNQNTPELRAVAVLEWTGDEEHPKASRIVPICIYDGQNLEDAGIYLARPEPLALETDVEYQLQQDGKAVGLFDIEKAGREQGSWMGYGKWRPLPRPKPAQVQVAKVDEEDTESDEPILHRKHHAEDSGNGSGSGGSSGSGSESNAPPPDSDRPTLHRSGDASSGNSSGNSGGNSGSGGTSSSGSTGTSSSSSTQTSDSGGPTLHRGGDASSTGSSGSSSGNSSGAGASGTESSAPPPDSDRPILRRSDDNSSGSASAEDSSQPKLKKKQRDQEDDSYVEDMASVTDPNRPRLVHGKAPEFGAPVLPSLMGLPADMHQEVAVSDAQNRPEHLWDYSWANPDDEAKMKADMEDLARAALGLNPPPAAKPAPKRTTTAHRTTKPAAPPPPAPLLDEQFRVFELAYGSGATMVLSAHTAGSGAQEKFVTLVAQPDLYGNVAVLLKNVTDAAHLDDTPRWRLVDAVDALADNRGELLFELRGATQRQFALYRVLRGQATRIFVSDADAITAPISN